MELADAVLITKADGTNKSKASKAASEYRRALHLLQPPDSGWTPKVNICSAINGEGIKEAAGMIEEFRKMIESGGYKELRRKQQQVGLLRQELDSEILRRYYESHELEAQLTKIEKKKVINPFAELNRLLGKTGEN
jgi:LAO/AO transport system kinase